MRLYVKFWGGVHAFIAFHSIKITDDASIICTSEKSDSSACVATYGNLSFDGDTLGAISGDSHFGTAAIFALGDCSIFSGKVSLASGDLKSNSTSNQKNVTDAALYCEGDVNISGGQNFMSTGENASKALNPGVIIGDNINMTGGITYACGEEGSKVFDAFTSLTLGSGMSAFTAKAGSSSYDTEASVTDGKYLTYKSGDKTVIASCAKVASSPETAGTELTSGKYKYTVSSDVPGELFYGNNLTITGFVPEKSTLSVLVPDEIEKGDYSYHEIC